MIMNYMNYILLNVSYCQMLPIWMSFRVVLGTTKLYLTNVSTLWAAHNGQYVKPGDGEAAGMQVVLLAGLMNIQPADLASADVRC